MKLLSHVLETKGFLHSLERTAQIMRRYSLGKRRFADMMSCLERQLPGDDIRVTFCITASLLDGHSRFIKMFQELGHEFAAHGYIHTNMKKKTKEEQASIVRLSYESFERHQIPVYGFRCPYLSYNGNTMEALENSSFVWTSNNVIQWEPRPDGRAVENHVRKLGLLYSFLPSAETISVPRFSGRLLDIPITAPDDEMIYERWKIRDVEAIAARWTRIMRKVYERGELFHLLFHPERFIYVKEAVLSVINESKALKQPVWFATLNRITEWQKSRKDIRWSSERLGERDCRVVLKAPPRSTVLIKRQGARPEELFYGGYAKAEPSIRGDGLFVFPAVDSNNHAVTVPEDCPQSLVDFLESEGFYTARAKGPDGRSLFIDCRSRFGEADKQPLLERIGASPYPVLRVWRWPDGARCAFTISSDVDSINVADFLRRLIHF